MKTKKSTYNAEKENAVFAKKLRKIAKEKGITQQALADFIGEQTGETITRQSVGQWFIGATCPPLRTVPLIAEFFGVSTDYLLTETETKSPDVNIQAIREYTRLSEEAAEKLHKIGLRNKITANSDTLSELIENEDFEYFLALLAAKMCNDNNSNKQIETGNARINIKVSALAEYEIGRSISEISTQMKDSYQKKYETVDERQDRLFKMKMYDLAEGLYKENRITEQEYQKIIAEYDSGNFEYEIGRKV